MPHAEFEALARLLEVAAQSGNWLMVGLLSLVALAWALRKRGTKRK